MLDHAMVHGDLEHGGVAGQADRVGAPARPLGLGSAGHPDQPDTTAEAIPFDDVAQVGDHGRRCVSVAASPVQDCGAVAEYRAIGDIGGRGRVRVVRGGV